MPRTMRAHRWGAAPDVRSGPSARTLVTPRPAPGPAGNHTEGAPPCPASSSSARSTNAKDLTQDQLAEIAQTSNDGRRLARRSLHLGDQLRRGRQDLLPARDRRRRDDPRARPSRRASRPTWSRSSRTSSARTPRRPCRSGDRTLHRPVVGARRARPPCPDTGSRVLGTRRRRPTVGPWASSSGSASSTCSPGRSTAAAAGTGSGVAVSGEPGAGKSALVEAACASDHGLRVLRGAVRPAGHAATPRARSATCWPTCAPLDGTAPLSEVCEAIYAALRSEPTVLVVEDLHWVDAASVEVLRFLVRRVEAMPVRDRAHLPRRRDRRAALGAPPARRLRRAGCRHHPAAAAAERRGCRRAARRRPPRRPTRSTR